MSRYRIITKGTSFYVQRSFFFFFWEYLSHYPRFDSAFYTLDQAISAWEFQVAEEAQKKAEKKRFKVVWTSKKGKLE